MRFIDKMGTFCYNEALVVCLQLTKGVPQYLYRSTLIRLRGSLKWSMKIKSTELKNPIDEM